MTSIIQEQETRRLHIIDGVNWGFTYSKIVRKTRGYMDCDKRPEDNAEQQGMYTRVVMNIRL
jgi:hypothetical protein